LTGRKKVTDGKILTSQASKFALGRRMLFRLRLRALRTRVWFKALSRIDRVLLDLVIKIGKCIRNPMLIKAVSSIVQKLEASFNVRVLLALERVGFPLARKFGELAESLGNRLAKTWSSDLSFAKFLAVMYINDPRAPKT
jgi:hypothetical protein